MDDTSNMCSMGIPFRSAEVRLTMVVKRLLVALEEADRTQTLIDPEDIREALKDAEDRVIVPTKTTQEA